LELLQFRNTNPAFGFDSDFAISMDGTKMEIKWGGEGCEVTLIADFATYDYEIICK